MKDNYYDAFIDSILSLPPIIRTNLLNQGSKFHENNNPYLFLWEMYWSESEEGQTLRNVLDEFNLAID
jgi:hypothetical protein